ncbi:hypothetical protein D1BOALGB6SA_7713 [Olavius sp. associated proteobacterium Delta 1]|nr:hypothetical protein D1BOALGB6SA_7713 [Olavius sp. associated proteobacterium Delta 1]
MSKPEIDQIIVSRSYPPDGLTYSAVNKFNSSGVFFDTASCGKSKLVWIIGAWNLDIVWYL